MSLGPHALLRKRYTERRGEFVYLEEVRNATGIVHGRTSYADALALSVWPSRGIELHGHEIKVSRSDLLVELKDPSKSAPIQKYCDRWWIVLGAPDLIQPGELPPTWGLMAVTAGRLRVVTEAPKLERVPWDPVFIASLLRSVTKDLDRTHVSKTAHEELRTSIEEEVKRRVNVELSRMAPEYARLREACEAFEKTTGQNIAFYSGKEMGELVRAAERLQLAGYGLDGAITSLEDALKSARSAKQHVAAQLGQAKAPGEVVADGVPGRGNRRRSARGLRRSGTL